MTKDVGIDVVTVSRKTVQVSVRLLSDHLTAHPFPLQSNEIVMSTQLGKLTVVKTFISSGYFLSGLSWKWKFNDSLAY